MIAQISNYVLGAIGGCYMAIITVIFWLGRTKVNHKLCDTVQDHNKTEHANIRKWIEDAEERAKERHTELKADLGEVKDLIKNNGH